MLSLTRVYETILYCPEPPGLVAAGRFYKDVLGLRPIKEDAALLDAFRLPQGGVLLLFDPHAAIKPGREVPSHGGIGPGHVAFSIESGSYDQWRAWLEEHRVAVEQEMIWKTGAKSIYVRDPAGNSVELVEGEIWGR